MRSVKPETLSPVQECKLFIECYRILLIAIDHKTGSTVKMKILRNGLCLPKCVLDVAVSIAASVIVSLLLLSGDIEQNPGPLGGIINIMIILENQMVQWKDWSLLFVGCQYRNWV